MWERMGNCDITIYQLVSNSAFLTSARYVVFIRSRIFYNKYKHREKCWRQFTNFL
uniref:Uncharacterized protein n=1 Tax=Ciona intestinalis TaxID=7719 RepID=H2XKH0_CIOIN